MIVVIASYCEYIVIFIFKRANYYNVHVVRGPAPSAMFTFIKVAAAGVTLVKMQRQI